MAEARSPEKPAPEEAKPEDIVEVTKSTEGRPDIEVTFFYILHSPEYVDEVWEEVKNADVFYLESVGGTKASREENLILFNHFLSLAQEEPDNLFLQTYVEWLRETDNFAKHFVAKMIEEGGGKRIGYIDISEEIPEYRESATLSPLNNKLTNLVYAGRIREAAKTTAPRLIETLATSSAKRNQIVASQLREEFKNLKKGEKAAVIQGRAHGATYSTIAAESPATPISSVSVPPDVVFSPMQALVQRKGASVLSREIT